MSSTAYAKYHSTSLSSQLENVYFLYGVILNRKQSASDCGSSWIWIPAFAGMTRLESFASNGNDTPLSSSTESKALRIGDPSPPVIPHLMRDPDKKTGFPFSRE